MKYFAKLNNTNEVINVECVNDDDAPTEQDGIDFLITLTNHQNWKQSFEDGTRKNPAGIGGVYDSAKDAFIAENPSFSSWILNEDTCRWEAPTAMPDDGKDYKWNEDTTTWNEVTYSG